MNTVCAVCNRYFATSFNLKRHMETVHGEEEYGESEKVINSENESESDSECEGDGDCKKKSENEDSNESSEESDADDKYTYDEVQAILRYALKKIKTCEDGKRYRVKTKYRDVTISAETARLLVADSDFNISNTIAKYLVDYYRNKPALRKIRLAKYRVKYPSSSYHIEDYIRKLESHEYLSLVKYFGLKKYQF